MQKMRAFTGCQVVQEGSERGQPLGRGNTNTKGIKGRSQVGEVSPIFKSLMFFFLHFCENSSTDSHLAVPVISGALVKLLPQLEGDLSVLEGALGADDHLVALLADDDGGLGDVPHLPGGEAHAWTPRRHGGDRSTHTHSHLF